MSLLPNDSLLSLAQLLAPGPEGDSDDGADSPPQAPGAAAGSAGPGSIGPPSRAGGGGGVAARGSPRSSQEIWSAEEVPAEGSEYEDVWDRREQPEYEILFKQQVGAEDMFLGMSRKDPSTACCEDMLIKIKLPDTKASDITLDIREKLLDLRSPQKRLFLHLPHPVETSSGKACFLSEQAILEVTLRMRRELDFINFA